MHKIAALHAICTKESYRGQRLATKLIQEALHWTQERYKMTLLFTDIPSFYERLSLHRIQEYRFQLPWAHSQGTLSLRPVVAPQDNALFLRCFDKRHLLSNYFWVQDKGSLTAFNALFNTYPTYWSLYYSSAIDGLISYLLEGKTFHLFDVIATKMPSLDLILNHLPAAIEEIYFYFSPDRFTDQALAVPYLYDNGHLMVHGKWLCRNPLMISPLSRF